MSFNYTESITFNSICTLLRNKLKTAYREQADALFITEKTLQRWRNFYNGSNVSSVYKSPYTQLSDDNYDNLLLLIDTKCKERNFSFSEVLKSEFPDLDIYCSENEIKQVIINSLDFHLGRLIHTYNANSSINSNTYDSPLEFLKSCMNEVKKIKSIQMAFQSGANWIKNHEKESVLRTIALQGIDIKIIVNDQNTIGKIAETMHDAFISKTYIGYDKVISIWKQYDDAFNSLSFRISKYPLFRKIYIVNYTDNSTKIFIRDYAYGYDDEQERIYKYLEGNDPLIEIYKHEFDILWNKALIYSEWLKITSNHHEKMPAGKYIMLYLSHISNSESNIKPGNNFIVSTIDVDDNNNVQLNVNIEDTHSLNSSISEYKYLGLVTLTRNNIFFNLFDKEKLEQINISIKRPLHNIGRYIGIITGLSTQAQPVAFKCALFEYDNELLNKINIKKLSSILSCDNKNWSNNLMIIEEQDNNTFYSTQIMDTH